MSASSVNGAARANNIVRHKIWGQPAVDLESENTSSKQSSSFSDRDVLSESMEEDIPPAVRQHPGVIEDEADGGREVHRRTASHKKSTASAPSQRRDARQILSRLNLDPNTVQISSSSNASSETGFVDDERAQFASPSQAQDAEEEPHPEAPGVWDAAGGANVYDPNLSSLGALKHGTGKCRPCAWHWKSGGCCNGKACAFCHSCPEDELRRRRRENRIEKNQKAAYEKALGIPPQPAENSKGKRKGSGKGSASGFKVSL